MITFQFLFLYLFALNSCCGKVESANYRPKDGGIDEKLSEWELEHNAEPMKLRALELRHHQQEDMLRSLENRDPQKRMVSCTDGWTPYQGGCYILIPDQRDFVAAAATCEANGAYLVTIEDEDEDSFIGRLVTNVPNEDIWIGLNDRQTEGTWMWDGPRRQISYRNFISGMPDGGTSQNCAVISWGWDRTTKWDDSYCDRSFPFICESRPNDWVDLRTGHIYYMGIDRVNFDAAKVRCGNVGGYLVALGDANEDYVVGNFVMAFYDNVDIWIGLSDKASEGKWVWTDGSSAKYTNWLPNQPDDGEGQDCATYTWGWTGRSQWGDNLCDGLFPYICEA